MTKEELEELETMLHTWKRTIENQEAMLNHNEIESSCETMDINANEVSANLAYQKSIYNKKMLNEIEIALRKMHNGLYGICEYTSEPIEFGRLKANPIARYSIEAQNYIETRQRKT